MRFRRYLSDWVWTISPTAIISRSKLAAFADTHRGESCVIIGNGPSLNNMDLKWLKSIPTFGLNRIYLLFPELGFQTTYYVSVNKLVVEQCAEDIQNLNLPRFISWQSRRYLDRDPDIFYIRDRRDTSLSFAKRPVFQIWEGATVTYVAMQLAYFMGFKKVYLIGVDHSFSTKGTPHSIVESEQEDKNHFHPDYFGKGFRWQLPDLKRSEEAFKLARQIFTSDGRMIFDATVNGNLDVFPKIDYRSVI